MTIIKAPLSVADFKQAYHHCGDFKEIYRRKKDPKDLKVDDVYPDYYINDADLLVFKDRDLHRICVPSSRRAWLLKTMHDVPLAAHSGHRKLLIMMSTRFYFPRMSDIVKRYVTSCDSCQRNKAYNANTRGVPTPLPVPTSRFSVISLDILSEFPLSPNGNNAIVCFTDRLTKKVWIEPINKASSARDLALIFMRTVFRSQGMPAVLLSDRGSQFASEFWEEFFSLMRTTVKLTSQMVAWRNLIAPSWRRYGITFLLIMTTGRNCYLTSSLRTTLSPTPLPASLLSVSLWVKILAPRWQRSWRGRWIR